MKRSVVLFLVFGMLVTGACAAGSIFATPTPEPTATNTPLPTETPTVTPTSTATPSPTPLPTATRTPTPTVTPGPFSFSDDFAKMDLKSWSLLPEADWKDGRLVVGPFAPFDGGVNPQFTTCVACGKYATFSVSVEVTFLEGQVDRFYGVFAPIVLNDKSSGRLIDHMYFFGVSPWQAAVVTEYDVKNLLFDDLYLQYNANVSPSNMVNRLEVVAQPAAQDGFVDIFFKVNGANVYVLYSQKAVPSQVGLGMDFHSQQVFYDNFEFIEIEAGK